MTADLLNFYSNLFAVEVAVFGIISAVVFVFLQITHSHYPSKQNSELFKNVYLISYFIISSLSLFFIGGILYSLSFKATLGWENNAFLNELIINHWTGLVILLSFFIALILFFLLVFSNLKYLSPSKIILLLVKDLNQKRIIKFLLKRYGVPEPDNWTFMLSQYGEDSPLVKFIGDEKEEKEPTEKEKQDKEKKKAQIEKTLATQKKEAQRWTENVKEAPNPFELFESFIWKSIQNSDLNNIELGIGTFTKITKEFITNNTKESDEGKETWNINSQIVKKYLQYVVVMFSLFMESARKSGLGVTQIKITKSIHEMLLLLVKKGNTQEIKILLSFLKETADQSIGKYPVVFIEILEYYQSLVDYAFETDIEGKNKDWLDEIFRHIGWLGERLLTKTSIEQKPIMMDDQYTSEYDALLNVLFSYGYKYNYKFPEKYPLIYFDAIWVVFEQLVRIYKETKNSDVRNRIFDCVYIYSSFAIDAINASNNDGATLASMDLRKSYKHLIDEGVNDVAKDTLELMIEVAAKAVGNKDKLKKPSFLGRPLENDLKEAIISSSFPQTVKEAVNEAYIKANGNHAAIFEFIKQLASEMGTSFGFMFDWRTGEMYPDDDPRRR